MDHNSERVFLAIEAVAQASEPLSLEQIASAACLSRATVYRLVAALCNSGILLREPKGAGFSPGPRLGAIALTLVSTRSLHSLRQNILQSLAARIGETCNFTTLHDNHVLYVERVESGWPVPMRLKAGSTTPLLCTSSGKLYLSQMPAKERHRLLHSAPIPRFTDKTITDPAVLEAELREIRTRRIAIDDGGYLDGLVSSAVPVFGRNRTIIGTVSVHGPRERLSPARALVVVPELRRAAVQLAETYRQIVR